MPEFDHRPAQTNEIRGEESGIGAGNFYFRVFDFSCYLSTPISGLFDRASSS